MKNRIKKPSRRLAASIAIFAAFGICLNAAAFSVCAVGDSITQGGAAFTAHRVALENEFSALGWIVEWKGTRSDATWGSVNPCEGYSGQNAEYIADQYESHAGNVAADVLLLHAGHNYNAGDTSLTPTPMAVEDIVAAVTNAHRRVIAAAREKNAKVVVLYAKVITSGGNRATKYSYIPTLNTAIEALGAELNTETSPVVVVDMAEGWNYANDCVSDCVHPNATGATKMAKKWIAAIKTLNAAGTISNSPIIATDTTLHADARCDSIAVAPNATLNLNGHRLVTGGVSGGGAIISASNMENYSLPEGYTLLSWVQTPAENNTASCHVDVGIVPLATDRVETKVGLGNASGTQWVFGTYDSGNPTKRFDAYVYGGKLNFHLGNKNSTINVTTATYEIILDGSARKAIYAKNGEASGKLAIASGGSAPDRRLYLFAANNNGTVVADRMAISCKMHYFRVYDKDGNLKANMLPAKNPDNVAGFYDLVRNQFFAPVEGELRAGDDISFERLKYVATPAGNSSFVDTGYTPLLTDRVETKVRFGALDANQGVFSARQSATTNTFSCILYNPGGGNRKLRFDHHTTSPDVFHRAEGETTDTKYTADEDYDVVMDGNTCVFAINGDISSTALTANPANESANPGLTLRLFAVATKGSGHSLYAKSCRMYYFRLTDANGYERLNLIPVRKTVDGKVGFYDAAHNAFISLNDGTLAAGEALPELRDLTKPGGTCAMPTPSRTYSTTGGNVTNLFNNNFISRNDNDSRVLFDTSQSNQALPLRVDYDFGEGNEVAVNMYKIHAGYNVRAPKKWVLYGSNDSAAFNATDDGLWTALDSRDSQADWTHDSTVNVTAECRTKAFANDTPYRYYRLKVEKQQDESHAYLQLIQLEYLRVAATDNPGELRLAVADGASSTNSAVRLGGDMKVVKTGAGDFVSSVSNQFYTGGTMVNAGGIAMGPALSALDSAAFGTGALSLGAGTTFDLTATGKEFTPLANALSLPSTGSATLRIDGEKLKSGDHTIATGVAADAADHLAVDPASAALAGRRFSLAVTDDNLVLAIVPSGLKLVFK